MTERSVRWREIWKMVKPLKKLLGNQHELPRKFTPTKQRSQSVDTLFHNSRERTNNSVSINTLNNSKQQIQDQGKPSTLVKDKLPIHQKPSESIFPCQKMKHEVMRLPTIDLLNRRTTSSFSSQKYEAAISQMRKQFRQFKENVLEELRRQRQYVTAMTGQIVQKMNEEFKKLMAGDRQNQSSYKEKQDSSMVKNYLKLQMSSNFNLNPSIKTQTLKQTQKQKPVFQPLQNNIQACKTLIQKSGASSIVLSHNNNNENHVRQVSSSDNGLNIKNLLGGLSTLKKQLFQMDRLFQGVIDHDSKKDKK